MQWDRCIAAAFVVLVSSAIIGLSAGSSGASFTASTTNPNQSLVTSNVAAPATQSPAVSAIAGRVDLSWAATATPANGHTVTYLVFRNAVQIGTTASLTYSDTPPADGSYTYTIQTKIAQGAGFFTSGASPARSGLSDRTAPSMSMSCNGAACSSTTWYSTLNVTVTGADAGIGMAAGQVTRAIDGGAATSSAGGTATFAVAGDSATHSVAYSGRDSVGNASSTTTFSPLQVDQTAPTTPTGPTGMTGFAAGSVIVWWTASTDALSGLASYTVHRSNAVTSCPAVRNTANFPNALSTTIAGANVTGLVTGSRYCYYVTATDKAGNVSANSVASALITAR